METVRPLLKEPISIELHYPVKIGESEDAEVVSSLTFKRPHGKEMRDIPAKPVVGDLLKLAGRLSGHPQIVFDRLEMCDFNRVIEAMGDFLDDGQRTG